MEFKLNLSKNRIWEVNGKERNMETDLARSILYGRFAKQFGKRFENA